MVACDNEHGCPYEWVRGSICFFNLLLTTVSVPFELRWSETTSPRKMVLRWMPQEWCRGANRQERAEKVRPVYLWAALMFKSGRTTDFQVLSDSCGILYPTMIPARDLFVIELLSQNPSPWFIASCPIWGSSPASECLKPAIYPLRMQPMFAYVGHISLFAQVHQWPSHLG